jgi:Ca2+-binding EF-hand superfamily protein
VTVEELTEIMCSLGQPPIETQLKKIISEVDVEGKLEK